MWLPEKCRITKIISNLVLSNGNQEKVPCYNVHCRRTVKTKYYNHNMWVAPVIQNYVKVTLSWLKCNLPHKQNSMADRAYVHSRMNYTMY